MRLFGLALMLALAGLQQVASGAIVPPTGLAPGDNFRIVFVTSGTMDATSSDISDYNTYVRGLASLANMDTYGVQSVSWYALASTDTVDASVNVPSSLAPWYGTRGQLVFSGGSGPWPSGNDLSVPPIASLLAPIDSDENGTLLSSSVGVWTGSTPDGHRAPGQHGSLALGSVWYYGLGFYAIFGDFTKTGQGWMTSAVVPQNETHRLYAVSDVLTYEDTAAIPEPASIVVMGGLFATFGIGMWWRRRKAA
jgi:hypothetical protein